MCSARWPATPPSRVGLAGKRAALQLKFARPARAKHDRRRAVGPGARRKSQSRLSRSRLDPAWSLQECRWAPYVRGHDPGQGQLPCESYRPPGQLLETHPAALLADTYVLLAKNQSTLRRGGKGPTRRPAKSQVRQVGLVRWARRRSPALAPVLRQLPSPAQPASLGPSTSARIGERCRQAQAETGMAPGT